MQTITCACGEVFHVDELYIGRAFRCWRCGRMLNAAAAQPPEPAVSEPEQPQVEIIPPAAGGYTAGASWPSASPTAAAPQSKAGSQALAAVLITMAVIGGLALYIWGFAAKSVEPTSAARSVQASPAKTGAASGTGASNALGNGAMLYNDGADGLGELSIDNATQYDALVKLISADSMRTAKTIYVQGNNSAVLANIAPGAYIVRYGLGLDLDPAKGIFTRSAVYVEFSEPIEYSEVKSGSQIKYKVYELTLNTAHSASADIDDISAAEFTANDAE